LNINDDISGSGGGGSGGGGGGDDDNSGEDGRMGRVALSGVASGNRDVFGDLSDNDDGEDGSKSLDFCARDSNAAAVDAADDGVMCRKTILKHEATKAGPRSAAGKTKKNAARSARRLRRQSGQRE
jgi:hypothetical protein